MDNDIFKFRDNGEDDGSREYDEYFVKPDFSVSMYGELYLCDHPVYDRCTLYRMDSKGLAVIQQYCKDKMMNEVPL